MSAITQRKRTIGVAALMVLGLMAGFFVASTAAGEEYATVGTVAEDNQAYKLPLEEDQRIRFALDAHDGAQNPEAQFAVYDPQDRFFGFFNLAGDGDDIEMLAAQEGTWVVFVTQASDADLAVQFTEDDRGDENTSAADSLKEIEVTTQERTIATQDGGELDETFAERLAIRPAVAYLEFSGDVADLDATVETNEGVVYEVTDGQANQTEDGAVARSGQTQLTPGNLAEGTYKIQATADSFSGSLTFVYQTYDRGVTASTPEDPEAPEQPNPLEDAAPVGHVQEHEAYEVPVQGADELIFAIPTDASAHVFIYNGDDEVTQVVDMEAQENRYQKSHDKNSSEENGSEAPSPIQTERVNATDETMVVYVAYASGDDEGVLVALAGLEDAQPARKLELETQEVAIEHGAENNTAEANLTGGLVDFDYRSQEVFAMERKLTIAGPLGEIAVIHEQAKTFGASMYSEHDVSYENLSSGLIELTLEHDSSPLAQGQTTIELVEYVR